MTPDFKNLLLLHQKAQYADEIYPNFHRCRHRFTYLGRIYDFPYKQMFMNTRLLQVIGLSFGFSFFYVVGTLYFSRYRNTQENQYKYSGYTMERGYQSPYRVQERDIATLEPVPSWWFKWNPERFGLKSSK